MYRSRKSIRILAILLCIVFVVLSNTNTIDTMAAGSNKNKVVSSSKEMCVRGATLWPAFDVAMQDIEGNTIGSIKAGTPVLALSVSDKYFKIYYNKHMGYIENSDVFINLPDVMQIQTQYDITNSYSSIYKIHGDDIPEVTGEILYPYVKTGENTYLVPLLYQVALKLYDAEEEAISKGYTLKIYDAYRPYSVTKYIYEKTSEFVEENPVYGEYINEKIAGVQYGQSFFLAKSASNHNYGVAVDLTICDLVTGEELKMQSDMHELSPWSILYYNNDAANTLQTIMTSNGFGTLVSEWWHFEIKDYRNKVSTFQAKPYQKVK